MYSQHWYKQSVLIDAPRWARDDDRQASGRRLVRGSAPASVQGGTAGGAVMAEAASAAGAPKVSRLDRRKARTRQALIDAAVRLIAEGRGDRASIARDHRGGRHRLRVVLQPLRQQGAAVPDRLRGGAGTLGAADRPRQRRHHRPGGAVRRGHADHRAARLDPPRHRRVPHRHRPGCPGYPHRPGAACAARHPGGAGGGPVHRSRSGDRAQRGGRRHARAAADVPAAPRTRRPRPPSTSSPRPNCACSASPPKKPPVSPPSRSLPLRAGNSLDDAVGRLSMFPGPR